MAVLESRLARRNSVRRAQHELKKAAQQTLGAQPASPKRVCSNAFQSAVVQKKRKRKARRTIIRQRRSATSDQTTELYADVCLSQVTVASKGRLPFTSVSAHCLHCSFVWFASICISNRNEKRWAPVAQSPLRRSAVHFWLPDVQLEDPQPRAGESMRSAYTPHGRKHYGSGGW